MRAGYRGGGVINLGLAGLSMKDVFSVEPIAEKGPTLGAAASFLGQQDFITS